MVCSLCRLLLMLQLERYSVHTTSSTLWETSTDQQYHQDICILQQQQETRSSQHNELPYERIMWRFSVNLLGLIDKTTPRNSDF